MKYIIAGFGIFGRLALERLSSDAAAHRIIVIDTNLESQAIENLSGVEAIRADAVSFLVESGWLEDEDLVIPMVPFNLAARYVRGNHPEIREIPLPRELDAMLPNLFRLNDSNLCCSRASFMCPDDCPEGELCMVTGEPRDEPLFETLAKIAIPGFGVIVQRSFQVLPGIGGYSLADLRSLGPKMKQGPCVLATSCKCHGILTGLRR